MGDVNLIDSGDGEEVQEGWPLNTTEFNETLATYFDNFNTANE